MNEKDLAWIGLALLPGTHPLLRTRLVETAGDPLTLFESPGERLAGTQGISAELMERIGDFDWMARAKREIDISAKHNIHILTPDSPTYPASLHSTPDPPPALWVRGEPRAADQLSVAIVGSRAATPYGLEVAAEIAAGLASKAVAIVSGLAVGIDAAAHRAALEAGGRTIAFLGCGLDAPYPACNRRLMEEIVGRGAVFSEYPVGTRPERWHFPERNRLIAGFALGTVVVEANDQSGAFHTANAALNLGREVWAVPGRVTSRTSLGTNALLRDHAAGVARHAGDVLADLPWPWRGLVAGEAEQHDALPLADLPPDEAALLGRIGADEPVHVDRLARETRIPVGALLDALVRLEVRRLIRACPGGRYLRRKPSAPASASELNA
jgi:DNA processing protein